MMTPYPPMAPDIDLQRVHQNIQRGWIGWAVGVGSSLLGLFGMLGGVAAEKPWIFGFSILLLCLGQLGAHVAIAVIAHQKAIDKGLDSPWVFALLTIPTGLIAVIVVYCLNDKRVNGNRPMPPRYPHSGAYPPSPPDRSGDDGGTFDL